MELTNYCMKCGLRRAEISHSCSNCGQAFSSPYRAEDISPKNFGVAAALCGVFGLAGIHHFYLGNILHGLIDLGMLVTALFLINSPNDIMVLFGVLLILIDALHSGIVMYLLFIGNTTDAHNRLVIYPGQLK